MAKDPNAKKEVELDDEDEMAQLAKENDDFPEEIEDPPPAPDIPMPSLDRAEVGKLLRHGMRYAQQAARHYPELNGWIREAAAFVQHNGI